MIYSTYLHTNQEDSHSKCPQLNRCIMNSCIAKMHS